ncbi:AMP-binding protein, partial [Nocardia farcinica]|uniref:AMP-binding protein n=1 Tax=Nocardia farcinica TaxID=37329 RepID=UPI002455FFA3
MRTTVLGGRERWGQRLVDYPPERAERYRRAGAWTDTPLAQRLHEIAARFPERPAVVTAAASVTYAELDRATDRIAVGLDALGLRPGDPVLFQATNRLETVYAWYGCLKAGLVPVATLAAHRAHEIGHISRKVGAVAHLVETGLSFDLVAFARDQAQGHPTLRHILTVGDPAGAVAIESLGAGIPPEQARGGPPARADGREAPPPGAAPPPAPPARRARACPPPGGAARPPPRSRPGSAPACPRTAPRGCAPPPRPRARPPARRCRATAPGCPGAIRRVRWTVRCRSRRCP